MTELDLAVQGADNKLHLVVEVKSHTVNPQQVVEQFRKILNSPALSADAYFMLVTPIQTFVWHRTISSKTEPDTCINTAELLADCIKGLRVPLESLNSESLQLIVRSWLSELVEYGSMEPSEIQQIGLVEAIRGGRITTQVAA